MPFPPLRRLVGIVALFVAGLIAIVLPTGYLVEQSLTEQHVLRFKARASASRIARYIYVHPSLWQYQAPRIADAITLPPEDAVSQTVLDDAGNIVLEEGPPAEFPSIKYEIPIIVGDEEVGRLVVATTLQPVLVDAALVTCLSWALAGLAFAAVRWLPIRALDRAMGELGRQRARFEAALEHMTQGLCMLDENQCVGVVNGRFAEMFGQPNSTSLSGLHVRALVDRLVTDSGMDRAVCERVLLADVRELSRTSGSATVRTTEGRMINVARSQMQAGIWVATFEDVTDQWRADEAEADRGRALAEARLLREREQAAQEATRAKSRFLATMSHEIRTPMNAVLGLASSLLDSPLTDEQRTVIGVIQESGDSLLRIINDILDYSKLEAGQLELESLVFSPSELSEAVQAIMAPRAIEKGLAFTVQADAILPSSLSGDPGRIRQILMNLVSNAIKFTHAGQVAIEARSIAADAEQATVEWRVRDTGIGIAADKMDSVFGEFVQADGSISRRFGGSGLGLAISRRLAEQMGSQITVESSLGEGTTFAFRVTLPRATRPGAAVANSVSATTAFETHIRYLGRRPRILVAEDNRTNQFVIRQMLKGFDAQVDIVDDGLEAVAAATRSDYDIICMDVQMPGMDGISATRVLRAKGGHLATMPIIALTGNAFQEDIQACLEAGMSAFIAKPVKKDVLLTAIMNGMSKLEARTAA